MSTLFGCSLEEFGPEKGKSVGFFKASLHEKPVFVLTWAATEEMLCYRNRLLYVLSDNADPKTQIWVDSEKAFVLRCGGAGSNYQNPDVLNWTGPDSSDYEFREQNRQLFDKMHDTWVKEFGAGAYVKIARGVLVSVSDRWDDSDNCPALLTFVDHIGFKRFEIAPGYRVYNPLVFPGEQ